MKDEINVNVNAPEGVLVIRHGEAPDVEQTKGIKVSGQMGTCLEFIKARKPDPSNTHVVVNVDAGTITLRVGTNLPESQQHVFNDKITIENHFTEFGLNGGKVWDANSLGMFLKRRRKHFPDLQANMQIVEQLLNFRANVETALEQVKDTTARKYKNAVERVVNSGLPTEFKLRMPIVKGQAPQEFTVEMILEPKDGTVGIYLDSIEAEETLEALRVSAIAAQVVQIAEKYPVFYV